MKILAVNFNNFKKQNVSNKQNQQQTNIIQKEKMLLPTTAQYLAFMGGYSLDLKETHKQLKEEQYPIGIKSAVERTLEAKNPQNKTLYDVHFEKYKGILDCYSLEELKERFPEFENVKSAWEVDAKEKSFIGSFQNDNLNSFQHNEDLTLQLIKLYWGQGFSLTDLSNYVAENSEDKDGINLYYAMKVKLNIPLMDSRYASVLKLSNKQYNESFTSQMSIKLKEASEAKIQKQEGEAVIIPSGPLSEPHKKHISEGLKKHFQEHPEKIYEMSKRQKEFYKNNPNRVQELSEIATYAYYETKEGQSILKHLSKFSKKYHSMQIPTEELTLQKPMTAKSKNVLIAFWEKNKWAGKQMSIAMKKANEHFKELKENPVSDKKMSMEEKVGYFSIPNKRIAFSDIPTQVRQHLNKWIINQGLNPDDYVMAKGVLYIGDEEIQNGEELEKVDKKSVMLLGKYLKEHEYIVDLIANAYQLGIVETIEILNNPSLKYKLPKEARRNSEYREYLAFMGFALNHENPFFRKVNGQVYCISGIEKERLSAIQQELIRASAVVGWEGFADYLQKNIDAKFEEQLEKNGIKLN
ncbi:MAG: hypothetical protein IJB79_02025 [Candidatus Gastranaerophilales bacterium]|nr:hypothetical protein [Candidatus Gastranaerophilales bacterium]